MAVRANHLVGRLGGVEFALVSVGSYGEIDPEAAAKNSRDRVSLVTVGPYRFGDVEINYSGANVGVVVLETGSNPGAALQNADAAMYENKR